MSDERPIKSCPDCAETVLADARKCRYCGYRFDGRQTPVSASSTGGVLGLLRRPPPPPTSVADLLDGWGVRLRGDDGTAALCFGAIAGASGYVVVTQTRFLFVPLVRGDSARPVEEEHLLRDLIRIRPGRHHLRRALFIEWLDTSTVVELDGAQLKRLQVLLTPYALP